MDALTMKGKDHGNRDSRTQCPKCGRAGVVLAGKTKEVGTGDGVMSVAPCEMEHWRCPSCGHRYGI